MSQKAAKALPVLTKSVKILNKDFAQASKEVKAKKKQKKKRKKKGEAPLSKKEFNKLVLMKPPPPPHKGK